ncbi:MAG: hypothetical protein WCK54_18375 [Desulfuromonadales bacterium]
MTTDQTAALLFDLDVCQSLFTTLAHQLENSSMIADYHPLAVLAAEGAKKIGSVLDSIDRAGLV